MARWRGARREHPLHGLRPMSNKARRPLARKPSGRRSFCPWPALARPLQPAAGMRGACRLGHSQNLPPQRPLPFPDRLLVDARRETIPRLLLPVNPAFQEKASFRVLLAAKSAGDEMPSRSTPARWRLRRVWAATLRGRRRHPSSVATWSCPGPRFP
jgi:hypothetical protein